MQISKNKTMASLIALFLMLTIAASLIAVLPTVSAVTVLPNQILYIFVTARPYTGVGEQVEIVYCIDYMPPDVGEITQTAPSTTGRAGWDGITLTITRPDGTNETLTMGRTDPVGGGYTLYTPAQVGVHTIQVYFAGQWKNQSSGTTAQWFMPCMSRASNFTVQTEPIPTWPEAPLPSDYWMRPISGPAHSWVPLATNWLGIGNSYPLAAAGGTTGSYSYGSGPTSAHILWTHQFYPTGSIADSRFGSQVYTLSHYESVDWSAIIEDGQIHMMDAYSATGEADAGGWVTWDLYTGEQIAYRPGNMTNPNGGNYGTNYAPNFGSIYYYDSGNQHGTFDYLWRTGSRITNLPEIIRLANASLPPSRIGRIPIFLGRNYLVNRMQTPVRLGTVWEMLDGYTGNTLCYIANVSTAGSQVYGSDGSIDYYNAVNLGTTAAPNYRLTMWNSSAGTMIASDTGTSAWQWRPQGMDRYSNDTVFFGPISTNAVHNGELFWWLNVSIPSLLGPRNSLVNQTATIQAVREGEYIIFGTAGRNDERGLVPAWFICLSLKRGEEGRQLWTSTITPPKGNSMDYGPLGFRGVYPESDIAYWSGTDALTWWFYDVKTGTQLWSYQLPAEEQLGYYGLQQMFFNGTVILGGAHCGILHTFDVRSGDLLWTAYGDYAGTDSPYGRMLLRGFAVAQGVGTPTLLYTGTGEHSPSSPLWRTEGIQCWNIETGEKIWGILFWGGGMGGGASGLIADGILVGWNIYDGQVYAFGKGPSATTVSAPQTAPALGTSVTITGTVTDQTPTGRRNVNNDLQFALKDTPAISDADMSAWMEYTFMGQGYPTNAKGVNVTLDALDPNGNFIHIGTTTSDITGAYGLAWQPEVPGTYQIYATFAGSKSYYGSSDITYMTVGEAPPIPAEPQPEPPLPPFEMYTLYATIAMIIAVAIATLLILRKK